MESTLPKNKFWALLMVSAEPGIKHDIRKRDRCQTCGQPSEQQYSIRILFSNTRFSIWIAEVRVVNLIDLW